MEPIVISAKTMLESAGGLIQTARALAVNPRDPPRWSVLAGHSRTVSDSIKKLITSMRDKAPGQLECETAIAALNSCLRDLDQASLAAVSQQLAPREGISQEVRINVFKSGDFRLREGYVGREGVQRYLSKGIQGLEYAGAG